MTYTPVLALLLVLCAANAFAHPYVTAQTIHDNCKGSGLKKVKPFPVNCYVGTCEYFLDDYSCLGPFGPASAYGPLGMIGPLGAAEYARDLAAWGLWVLGKKVIVTLPNAMMNPGNPDNHTTPTSWLDWSVFSFSNMTSKYGPMSVYGPLGPYGPLGDAYYSVMPTINDFTKHLAAQGLWSVLGPLGPFGPLGGLGPLGPLGGHGLATDKNGNYISKNNHKSQIVRTYPIPWNPQGSEQRIYELFENYDPEYAKQMANNDCSWMVHSLLLFITDSDTFSFTSANDQFVTVLVVPQYQLDDFDLQLTLNGQTTIESANVGSSFIDWIQVFVPAGTKLDATVKFSLTAPLAYWTHEYRLYVVGSTQYFTTSDITGPHVMSW